MYVDWGTKVIHVPQSDLAFVTGVTYELDTDWFRLTLKDLEDDADGMPFLDTHRHNTEVTVAGATFARVIEIINGYQVEFEDTGTHYTIRLVGSNNNIFADGVLIPHMYGIISTNSAGLIVTSGTGGSTPAEIADAVWDEALAGHAVAGSSGEALSAAGGGADPAAIADAVWDEALGAHTASGSFGEYVQKKLITVGKYLGLK